MNIKKIFITALFALATLGSAIAQPVVGDNAVANTSFDDFTTINDANGAVLYKVPVAWSCTNYPRINQVCQYKPGQVSLWSVQAGGTVAARQARPSNPQWYQAVQVQVAGTYNLVYTVIKSAPSASATETYGQALVLKVGTATVSQNLADNYPLGVPVTVTQAVQLPAGISYLYLGFAKTGPFYGGFLYNFTDVQLNYAGY